MSFSFLEYHRDETVQYTMILRLLYVVIFIAEWYSTLISGSSSIHMLMNVWVLSSFSLFWIELLWTFEYKSLQGHVLSFLLDKHLRVELLSVTAKYTFKEAAKLFSNVVGQFYISISNAWEFWLLIVLPNLILPF